jgi:hypothetical protein
MAGNRHHQTAIFLEKARSHNHHSDSVSQFGSAPPGKIDRDKQKNPKLLLQETFPRGAV